ncbi:MAG TPA: serine/threonine protein phosphatase [Idiomarina baltica]|uniref:Serine/threonine protein phosphatase n=1 Tax=Idiomarina baltica TaxID=190892 RepID=A0A348WQG0_9GAMM|nr:MULTISPECIES: sulfur transferase domain-containing protein [unclassified Idiomarina]KXS34274.1 MAG: Ser/Thr protein phosphatase, DSPc family protein [Idiomarina sp. T82-3]HAR56772.1 serine/threonine protein phosphatase [Idiomarina baltica]|tara:strand:- start:5980 stop:6468 length:489 start_codon:yes stop_codon:yes gene_type:complete
MRAIYLFAVVILSLPIFSTAKGIETAKQVEQNLWVMGMPAEADIERFAEQGGDIVISLLSVPEQSQTAESTWVTENGMAFYHVAIPGADGLTLAKVRLLDKVLLEHKDKNVLVHCASGNRVGALFALRAAWLDGKEKDLALKIGRERGLTSLEKTVSEMLAQ